MPATMKRGGGTKKKIAIEKRHTKQQRSVACSKRRQTVFAKAADLCLHSGANVAVFVTSPAENSQVVYSFSGYSPASEIADAYLNGKAPPAKVVHPQSKLGFWWEDPDLYRYCDDISELNVMEERLMRAKKHLISCLEKKEKSQSVSDQNTSSSSLDQNNTKSSSPSSCDQIASFEHNCFSSLDQVTCFRRPIEDLYASDQSRYLVNDDLGFVDSEREKELFQETQSSEEDQSLWENLVNVFCLNKDNNINLQVQVPVSHHSSIHEEEEEEEDLMIDITQYLNEEEIQS